MAKSNEHPGHCVKCRCQVERHAGFVERHNGRWFVRCANCIKKRINQGVPR